MAQVIRGRHVGYNAAGTPKVVELTSLICAATPPDFPPARHVRYTPSGVPVVMESFRCCDVYSETRVETAAFAGGIMDRVLARSFNNDNCFSGHNKRVLMTYAVDRWTGSLMLRGGNVPLELLVDAAKPDNDPEKFTLRWKDCADVNWREKKAGYNCNDPLFITFPLINVSVCCDCDTAHTSEGAFIDIEIETNCKKTQWARHIDYTSSGVPVVAVENCGEPDTNLGCGSPHCGLVATVTGACSCLNGTYDLNWISLDWKASGIGTCSALAEITLLCTDNGNGTSTLRLTATCGANDTGFATVVIDNKDTENLDVTFTVPMTGPAAVACGGCTWEWQEMPMAWAYISDTCTLDCNCTGTAPTTPGTVDGQRVTVNCNGTVVVCCQGSITVRVTR